MTVVVSGDFGKPRPALIIQSNQFAETGSLTVLLISGTPRDAPLIRISVSPTPSNGLRRASQIMIDKAITVKRVKIREAFGHLDDETMISVNRLLALFLGLA